MKTKINQGPIKTVLQLDEGSKSLADFFALLFRIDQRIKKSKEPVCNMSLAKSK
jgi:hypothetical protein